jgi:hypothetical protein
LQPAVGIEQLGAGQPRAGDVIKGALQGLEPIGRHLGIVVWTNEKLSPGRRRLAVTRTDEAKVHIVPNLDQALHLPEHL